MLRMRAWLDRHAGGSPPWPAHMRGAEPLLANLGGMREEQVRAAERERRGERGGGLERSAHGACGE